MKPRAHYRGGRFVRALQKHGTDFRLPNAVLSQQCGVSVATLTKWFAGKATPTPRLIAKVCRALKWDACQFDVSEDLYAAVYDGQFLSINTLVERFQRTSTHLLINSLSLVPVAGALLYSRFCDAGFACILFVSNFDVELQFLAPSLSRYNLLLQGSSTEGSIRMSLVYTMENRGRMTKIDWTPLSEAAVDHFSKVIKTL